MTSRMDDSTIDKKDDPFMKSYLPVRSYDKTMSLFVLSGDGTICSVSDCPSTVFGKLMQVAATTTQDSEAVFNQMKSLDFAHPADRWFCCELISENGGKLPLFSTSEEAKQSIVIPAVK